jgi:hypothetical protein
VSPFRDLRISSRPGIGATGTVQPWIVRSIKSQTAELSAAVRLEESPLLLYERGHQDHYGQRQPMSRLVTVGHHLRASGEDARRFPTLRRPDVVWKEPRGHWLAPRRGASSNLGQSAKAVHDFWDNSDSSAKVGSRPAGVRLLTTPGKTCESCLVSSSSGRPVRPASDLMISGPSAEPSCPGATG